MVSLFHEFISLLRERSKEVPIVVEGKNDERVLRRFGIKNVITLSGKNYHDLLEEIPEETTEVVLLTDVDKQGEKIFRTLKKLFESQNLKVDGSLREYLRKLDVEEVEDLPKVLYKEKG